jgi:hypothetical protein
VELCKSEKVANPQGLRIQSTFLDILNSTFTYPSNQSQCPHFRTRIWFLLTLGRLGLMYYPFTGYAKCQKPDIFRILTFFSDIFKIPFVSTSSGHEKCCCFYCLGVYTEPHSYGRKKTRHFIWSVRVSTLTNREKGYPFCCLGALTQICTTTERKRWDT